MSARNRVHVHTYVTALFVPGTANKEEIRNFFASLDPVALLN